MFELSSIELLLTAVITLVILATIFGVILGYAAVSFKVEGNPLADQIDTLLPQTQCGNCGYPGCKPYAQAIVDGEEINKCPPGGQATIDALASLLDVPAPELDAEHGEEAEVKSVAYILRVLWKQLYKNSRSQVRGTNSV